MNAADSVGLTRTVASRRPNGFVYTVANVSPDEPMLQARSISDLLGYARRRARQHERLTIQAVTFNGWQGRALQLGPIYVKRTADDFGAAPRYGMGMQEAISAPRFSATTDTIDISNRIPRATQKAVEAMGYAVKRYPGGFVFAGVHGISMWDGRLEGGADPQRDGYVGEVA